MGAPRFVPADLDQLPRTGDLQRFPVPRGAIRRPAENTVVQPRGRLLGTPTPDAGYALRLVRHLAGRVELGASERLDDALWAGALLGMKRAGTAGRGPILADVERGLTALGYLGGAPESFVAWRARAFAGVAHSDQLQRLVSDRCSPEVLDQDPEVLRAGLTSWRTTFAGWPGVEAVPAPRDEPTTVPAPTHEPPPERSRQRRCRACGHSRRPVATGAT